MIDAFGNPIHFTDRISTDATVEPLSVGAVKDFLRVDLTTDDAFLSNGITECRRLLERKTGRAMLTQSRTMTLDQAPAHRKAIWLPCAPVSAITSITQYSTADVGTAVATSVYRLDSESCPPRIVLKDGQNWASGLRPQNAFVIVYVAGYGAAAENITDPELLHALRLLLQLWYEKRDADSDPETYLKAVDVLIGGLRLPWL